MPDSSASKGCSWRVFQPVNLAASWKYIHRHPRTTSGFTGYACKLLEGYKKKQNHPVMVSPFFEIFENMRFVVYSEGRILQFII